MGSRSAANPSYCTELCAPSRALSGPGAIALLVSVSLLARLFLGDGWWGLLGVPTVPQGFQLSGFLRFAGREVFRFADVTRQVEKARSFSSPFSLPATSFQSPWRMAHCSPKRQ